jgi:hypothetical protein
MGWTEHEVEKPLSEQVLEAMETAQKNINGTGATAAVDCARCGARTCPVTMVTKDGHGGIWIEPVPSNCGKCTQSSLCRSAEFPTTQEAIDSWNAVQAVAV